MIIWVAEVCEKVLGKKLVYIATDDDRIHAKAKEFGFYRTFQDELKLVVPEKHWNINE